MGKLFRANPIQIAFPDAVSLFSARAKFVREGSQKSTVRLLLFSFLLSLLLCRFLPKGRCIDSVFQWGTFIGVLYCSILQWSIAT